MELSHRLNIGSLRNISIKRAAPRSPEKARPAPAAEKEKPKTEERKADVGPPPTRLPPGVHLSSKTTDFKRPNISFTKLPSGISFSTFKAGEEKKEATPPPAPSSEDPAPPPTPEAPAFNPMDLIKNVNWGEVFKFTGVAPSANVEGV